MKTNAINNNRDYNAIAKRIEELVDADPKTPAALELREHICAIIAYEQAKSSINACRTKNKKQ